jgi:Ca-activated chloride channel family protein
VDTTIILHAPIALDNGTDPTVTMQTVPSLESPTAAAQQTLIDLFRKVKKKTTLILVMDTSQSMAGDKLNKAKAAVIGFLDELDKGDWVSVLIFNDTPVELQPAGVVSSTIEKLKTSVDGLFAEGNTALYDAVCQAVDRINERRAQDEKAKDPRLYAIVVLSDGKDTAGVKTENDMKNICLPSGEDVAGVRVFTLPYGEDADKDLLLQIANRTNAETYEAGPETIEKILEEILKQ